MIESTAIDKSKTTIGGDTALKIQAMTKSQIDKMKELEIVSDECANNQRLTYIYQQNSYIRELESKVLALQSKLDEIEKQEPVMYALKNQSGDLTLQVARKVSDFRCNYFYLLGTYNIVHLYER